MRRFDFGSLPVWSEGGGCGGLTLVPSLSRLKVEFVEVLTSTLSVFGLKAEVVEV
jgi:hypothetical protein